MAGLDLPLRTARLSLRPHRPEDLDLFAETYADPEVCRFLLHEPLTREQATAKLTERLTRTAYGEEAALALVLDAGDGYLGDVALFPFDSQPQTGELGWVLHPDHAGHGYAVEAAAAVIALAFDHYRLHRVVANLDARNGASARLCERLGMRREAHHLQDYWSRGEWTDSFVYAMLATDRGR